MIWLLLAAFGAAVTAASWALGVKGPELAAGGVAGLWVVGRAAMAGAARARRRRIIAPGTGSAERTSLGADGEALAGSRNPTEVAAIVERVFAAAAPGTKVELWLLGSRREWRQTTGAVIPCAPAGDRLLRFLAEVAGQPLDRAALAASGEPAAEEMAQLAPGPLVWPVERNGRVHGLLWVTPHGPLDGLDSLVAALSGPLADALGDVGMEIRIAQQTEVAAEVEVAAAVQQALIPDGAPRVVGPLELAGSYLPASRCGGDWWSVDELEGGAALVVIADVTGHGIGAARITAAARGAHGVALRLGRQRPELGALFDMLDAAVREVGAGHYHMTCFAAVVEPGGRILFTGAGHVAPYLVYPVSGAPGRIAIDALVARGNPLGIVTTPSLQIHEQRVASGSLLLFYSDGLMDCMNAREERLGDRRMQRLLREIAAESPPIGEVRDRIEAAVRAFAGGHPQPDDITFVACRVL
jgi:serine phosphatase RsbU (regulator of sigma subunit)